MTELEETKICNQEIIDISDENSNPSGDGFETIRVNIGDETYNINQIRFDYPVNMIISIIFIKTREMNGLEDLPKLLPDHTLEVKVNGRDFDLKQLEELEGENEEYANSEITVEKLLSKFRCVTLIRYVDEEQKE